MPEQNWKWIDLPSICLCKLGSYGFILYFGDTDKPVGGKKKLYCSYTPCDCDQDVDSSGKIQSLYLKNQVLLNLRFTVMERPTGY